MILKKPLIKYLKVVGIEEVVGSYLPRSKKRGRHYLGIIVLFIMKKLPLSVSQLRGFINVLDVEGGNSVIFCNGNRRSFLSRETKNL